MANQEREPFVLDFPNGQRVEDILKKAEADYSRAEIDALISRSVHLDTWNTVWESGQDLNTILTPGTYAAPTNAIAAACSNLPDGYTASGQAFKLIVEYTSTANFIRQTLIGRTGSLYARAYNVNESTFSSWEKYITSTEFAALEATCISPLLVSKPFNWVEDQGGGAVQIYNIGRMDKNNNGLFQFFIYGAGAPKTFTDGHIICSDLPIELSLFSGDLGGICQPIALFNSSTMLGIALATYSNYTKELIIRIGNGGSIDNVTDIQGEFIVPGLLVS